MTKAASITRLRFCPIWSALSMGLSIYGAATAPSDDWLAFNLACTLLNWLPRACRGCATSCAS